MAEYLLLHFEWHTSRMQSSLGRAPEGPPGECWNLQAPGQRSKDPLRDFLSAEEITGLRHEEEVRGLPVALCQALESVAHQIAVGNEPLASFILLGALSFPR